MAELWSPLVIETMLQAHYRGDGVLCGNHNSSAHNQARGLLIGLGLVEVRGFGSPTASVFATDLGRAFVSLLCATPVPVIRYVDPRMESKP